MRISSLHDDLLWPCVAHACGLGELDPAGQRRFPLAERSPLGRAAQFGVAAKVPWQEDDPAERLFDGYHAALAPALADHYETVVAAVFDRYLVDDLHRGADFAGGDDRAEREHSERERAAREDLARHGALILACGATRVLLAVEGMDYVRSEAQAAALWDAGVRVFAFQYNRPNALTHGDAARDDPGDEGLTPLGRRVAAYLLERGAVLDLAHAARSTRTDLLDLAEGEGRGAQISYTHGALREDADAARVATLPGRFLDAAEARRILRLGGRVGLTPARPFHPSPERFAARIASLVRNVEGGATGVALGTDFGGLADAALLPGMTRAPEVGARLADLLATRHGLGDDAIVAVLRGNATAYFP